MPRLTSGDDDDDGEVNGVDDDDEDGNYFFVGCEKKERLGEPSSFQPYFKKKYY